MRRIFYILLVLLPACHILDPPVPKYSTDAKAVNGGLFGRNNSYIWVHQGGTILLYDPMGNKKQTKYILSYLPLQYFSVSDTIVSLYYDYGINYMKGTMSHLGSGDVFSALNGPPNDPVYNPYSILNTDSGILVLNRSPGNSISNTLELYKTKNNALYAAPLVSGSSLVSADAFCLGEDSLLFFMNSQIGLINLDVNPTRSRFFPITLEKNLLWSQMVADGRHIIASNGPGISFMEYIGNNLVKRNEIK